MWSYTFFWKLLLKPSLKNFICRFARCLTTSQCGDARCCPSFTKKDECSEFIFELLEIDWEGAISSQCIFAKKVVSAESIIFAETSKFETWRYDSIHLNPLITMFFWRLLNCGSWWFSKWQEKGKTYCNLISLFTLWTQMYIYLKKAFKSLLCIYWMLLDSNSVGRNACFR